MTRSCFIVGVYKSGTSSLFTYLSAQAGFNPSQVKETDYFNRGKDLHEFIDAYYGDCDRNGVFLEASPGYFSSVVAAENIKACFPNALVLVVLREPMRRLESFYRYYLTNYRFYEKKSQHSFLGFNDFCEKSLRGPGDYVLSQFHEGLYLGHLTRWKSIFGQRLKVAFFDDLQARPDVLVAEICDSFGLSMNVPDFRVHNETVSYRRETLHRVAVQCNKIFEKSLRASPRVKEFLKDVYCAVNVDRRSASVVLDGGEFVDEVLLRYKSANKDLREYFSCNRDVLLLDSSLPAWLRQ